MKKLKNIMACILASSSLLASLTGTIVNANNCQDTDFTNYAVSTTYNKYTPTREKTDATSATVKVSYTSTSGCKMKVKVYGTYVGSQSPSSSNLTDWTTTTKIVGVSSTYTYLPNLVYERMHLDSNGNPRIVYCCLGFTAYSGASGFNATGVWSPDSV